MQSLFRAALVAAALLVGCSLPAAAQQAAPSAPATEQSVKDLNATVDNLKRDLQQMGDAVRKGARDAIPASMTTDQFVTIAIGAAAGAVIIDVLGGGGLATLAGAVIGGYAGHWFYTQPPRTVATGG